MEYLNSNSENKTPIEIALQIDDEGYTTAKALYNWLELDPSNYARWCRTNITENDFADENDYSSLTTSETGRGHFAQDYKISANLAKKISMLTKSERGEQARKYFLGCEVGLKSALPIIKEQSMEIQALHTEIAILKTQLEDNTTRLNYLDGGETLPGQFKRNWSDEMFKNIKELAPYYAQGDWRKTIHNLVDEMENHSGINYDLYAEEYKKRYPEEKKYWTLRIIAEFEELRDAFEYIYHKAVRWIGIEEEPDYNW